MTRKAPPLSEDDRWKVIEALWHAGASFPALRKRLCPATYKTPTGLFDPVASYPDKYLYARELRRALQSLTDRGMVDSIVVERPRFQSVHRPGKRPMQVFYLTDLGLVAHWTRFVGHGVYPGSRKYRREG
jgi:hypothetical protein